MSGNAYSGVTWFQRVEMQEAVDQVEMGGNASSGLIWLQWVETQMVEMIRLQ